MKALLYDYMAHMYSSFQQTCYPALKTMFLKIDLLGFFLICLSLYVTMALERTTYVSFEDIFLSSFDKTQTFSTRSCHTS